MAEITLEEESILKRKLLADAIDEELLRFGNHPTIDYLKDETVLLTFLYRTMLVDFPLFKGKSDKLRAAVDKIVTIYPKIAAVQTKATKDRTNSSLTTTTLMSIFDLIFRTPGERKYAAEVGDSQRFASLLEENILVRKDDAMYVHLASARKQFIQALVNIYQDVSSHEDGVRYFFDVLKKCNNVKELPKSYQGLFHALTIVLLPQMVEDYEDPQKVEKLKKMYHTTPRRTIKMILSMTNPFKIAGSLTSLFLVRPLGTWSLLQKMLENSTELPKTENLLKEVRKKMPSKELCTKIEEWVNKKYEPIGSAFDYNQEVIEEMEREQIEKNKESIPTPQQELESILCDNEITPILENSTSIVSRLTPSELEASIELVRLQKRRKDKLMLIELFGDPDLTEVIKEIFPALCAPLDEMYTHAGVPQLVQSIFDLMKETFTIGGSHISKEEKRVKYETSLEGLEQNLFLFLRNLVKSDAGTLEGLFNWMFEKFRMGDGATLDVEPLLKSIDEEGRQEVLKELKELLAFYKMQDEMYQVDFVKADQLVCPPHPAITKHLSASFRTTLKTMFVSSSPSSSTLPVTK